MSGRDFEEAARKYWAALGRTTKFPKLPDDPFDAFIELLHLGAEAERAFELVEVASTPYPGLVLGDKTKNWPLEWAVALAELEPFVLRGEEGSYFLADTHADSSGKHRVYSLDEGIRGLVEFASLADALHYMAAKLEAVRSGKPLSEAAEAFVSTLDDRWEDAPTSGFFVLETLLDLPFAEAYDAYSRGEWPVVDVKVPAFRFKRQGPWQRALALHLVHRFLTQRIVDMPRSLKPNELEAPVRALHANLKSFEEAMALGTVPEVIDALTDSDDPKVQKAAKAWVARHDVWRESMGKKGPAMATEEDFDDEDDPIDRELAAVMAKVLGRSKPSAAGAQGAAGKSKPSRAEEAPAAEAPAPEADTPFLRSLRAALSAAIDAMIDEEVVELDPSKKGALLAELVEAGSNARSAAHLLKSLTDAIVSSDLVDEVYASDDEVERFIRTRLEKR